MGDGGDGRRVGKEAREVEVAAVLDHRPGSPEVVEAPAMVMVEVIGPKLDRERERESERERERNN